jgi:hypothetical protein
MSNKVDKLFKDKLEEHSLQPSAQAWEKVEAHLGKKNKMVIWLRVAAVLMLFGVLTFVGLNWNDEEPRKELVKESGVRSQESGVKEQKVEEKPSVIEQHTTPKRVIRKKKKVIDEAPVVEKGIEQQIAVIEPQKIEHPTPNIEPITINQQPTTKKGITLTYSLPTIKKQEEPVLAQEEPKKTGLERVLEIAREVKNGDSPLAELREAKDDIFALDFRKDKNKKH